ncbi:MAG: magnesium transporter [Reyranella sp.]|uniref:magnesium transporter n=1 Tax=Reyranella sp. TaxID=1929291 RepID=UPI003D0CD505
MNGEAETLDEVPPELIRRVETALAEDRTEEVRSLLAGLSASGQAFVLEQVTELQRDKLVGILKRDLDPRALIELDEEVLDGVLEQLDSKDIAAAAHELEADDAALILEDLPQDELLEVLAELPPDERADIEKALAYPEGTAGRMMQRSLVKVPDGWTVGQVIDHCREATDLPDDVYDIFVVDATGRLQGSVPLGRMLRTKRPVPIRDIVDPDIPSLPALTEQAEVAHLFRDMNLVSCPVVDAQGRLEGVIMVDDVVDVIDEEAEADLLKMGGVGIDDMHANPVRTARLRAMWLTVNLATAVLASLVIGQFEHSIEKIVALAVLMPIVASMGGNAGTQTVTVAVRALAMGELTAANAFRFVAKEAAVGGLNGLVFAFLMGVAVVAWYGDWRLGAVIGAAMICNLLAAALAGTLIPLGLQKFGIDPAVSSTVFLTTVTDVIGFLAFLGLATAFLL